MEKPACDSNRIAKKGDKNKDFGKYYPNLSERGTDGERAEERGGGAPAGLRRPPQFPAAGQKGRREEIPPPFWVELRIQIFLQQAGDLPDVDGFGDVGVHTHIQAVLDVLGERICGHCDDRDIRIGPA